jgi:NADH-quinone oxidoreductase subunit H
VPENAQTPPPNACANPDPMSRALEDDNFFETGVVTARDLFHDPLTRARNPASQAIKELGNTNNFLAPENQTFFNPASRDPDLTLEIVTKLVRRHHHDLLYFKYNNHWWWDLTEYGGIYNCFMQFRPTSSTLLYLVSSEMSNLFTIHNSINYKMFLIWLVTILPILVGIAMYTVTERKFIASVQRRSGPGAVGTYGLLQGLADGLKLLLKEIIIPTKSYPFLFLLAPLFSFTISLTTFFLIPSSFFGFIENSFDSNYTIFFFLIFSSLGVYALVFGGWSSTSRYAALGALRAAAQVISYELSFGFIFFSICATAGSFNLLDIIWFQDGFIWFIYPYFFLGVIFLVTSVAETNRAPFDLPEAESELVAGYNVEYASIVFALFFLAEYSNILMIGVLFVYLFLGGLTFALYSWFFMLILCIKVIIVWSYYLLIRAVFPRVRFDQLMQLCWKWFLMLETFFSLFTVLWFFTLPICYMSSDFTTVPIVLTDQFFSSLVERRFVIPFSQQLKDISYTERLPPWIASNPEDIPEILKLLRAQADHALINHPGVSEHYKSALYIDRGYTGTHLSYPCDNPPQVSSEKFLLSGEYNPVAFHKFFEEEVRDNPRYSIPDKVSIFAYGDWWTSSVPRMLHEVYDRMRADGCVYPGCSATDEEKKVAYLKYFFPPNLGWEIGHRRHLENFRARWATIYPDLMLLPTNDKDAPRMFQLSQFNRPSRSYFPGVFPSLDLYDCPPCRLFSEPLKDPSYLTFAFSLPYTQDNVSRGFRVSVDVVVGTTLSGARVGCLADDQMSVKELSNPYLAKYLIYSYGMPPLDSPLGFNSMDLDYESFGSELNKKAMFLPRNPAIQAWVDTAGEIPALERPLGKLDLPMFKEALGYGGKTYRDYWRDAYAGHYTPKYTPTMGDYAKLLEQYPDPGAVYDDLRRTKDFENAVVGRHQRAFLLDLYNPLFNNTDIAWNHVAMATDLPAEAIPGPGITNISGILSDPDTQNAAYLASKLRAYFEKGGGGIKVPTVEDVSENVTMEDETRSDSADAVSKNPDTADAVCKNPDTADAVCKNPDTADAVCKNPDTADAVCKNPDSAGDINKDSHIKKAVCLDCDPEDE